MTVLTTFFVVNNMLLTTRYDTLQHATTRYNILQHVTTFYNMLQHYNTLQHYDTLGVRYTLRHSTSNSILLYSTLYRTILYRR
jgi:hypothetical protein